MSYEKPEDFAELTRYINWPLLQEQKLILLHHAEEGWGLQAREINAMHGIISLLDALQDLAVDSGLVDNGVVFGGMNDD